MAEGPAPKPAPTSEELHRGIIYLREDVKDLRIQIVGIHHRIDETNRSLGHRIDETNRSLGQRIDETNRSLGAQIQALHKRLDTHFMWTMTTLVAMTGVLIAVIKL